MSRFPTAGGHLANWAGLCPGDNESACKYCSDRTRRGDTWFRRACATNSKGKLIMTWSRLDRHSPRSRPPTDRVLGLPDLPEYSRAPLSIRPGVAVMRILEPMAPRPTGSHRLTGIEGRR